MLHRQEEKYSLSPTIESDRLWTLTVKSKLIWLAEEVKVNKAHLKAIGRKIGRRIPASGQRFCGGGYCRVVTIERNEIILERDVIIDEDHIDMILEANESTSFSSVRYRWVLFHLYNTLQKDPTTPKWSGAIYIPSAQRIRSPMKKHTWFIDKLFFSDKRYNLGDVVVNKINRKLDINIDTGNIGIDERRIISIVNTCKSYHSESRADDIDHLSNRRVRTVGEQLYAQLVLVSQDGQNHSWAYDVRDNEVFTPIDLINARTLSIVIIHSLVQVSCLNSLTKRIRYLNSRTSVGFQLSSGRSFKRGAGFEVRDVHYSHLVVCVLLRPEGLHRSDSYSVRTCQIINWFPWNTI